jgi:hypothetical protein
MASCSTSGDHKLLETCSTKVSGIPMSYEDYLKNRKSERSIEVKVSVHLINYSGNLALKNETRANSVRCSEISVTFFYHVSLPTFPGIYKISTCCLKLI